MKKHKEKFVSVVSRANSHSGVSQCREELEQLNKLGDKFPELPFGFLICLDTVSNQYGNKNQSRIDRRMETDKSGYSYRNHTALLITIVLHDEDFPEPTLLEHYSYHSKVPIPKANIAFARKSLGQELMTFFPMAFKKQVKNYPAIKEIADDFIKAFEDGLREIKWID
ncbi:hypothetical protein [Isobaculum melis]|uniref:Uncharacterized protein n=1 Tax=Isobaculum melis TaxID=142588 RepID=A0A1H9PS37_9LACT|nr:hypothetical protein [Isobaculum melis]SER51034.1 hypothetical protein SAMN04488559_101103 [Isobaculum melis]